VVTLFRHFSVTRPRNSHTNHSQQQHTAHQSCLIRSGVGARVDRPPRTLQDHLPPQVQPARPTQGRPSPTRPNAHAHTCKLHLFWAAQLVAAVKTRRHPRAFGPPARSTPRSARGERRDAWAPGTLVGPVGAFGSAGSPTGLGLTPNGPRKHAPHFGGTPACPRGGCLRAAGQPPSRWRCACAHPAIVPSHY
jgi:hypothetical protein